MIFTLLNTQQNYSQMLLLNVIPFRKFLLYQKRIKVDFGSRIDLRL
jgi:hypothetical protein